MPYCRCYQLGVSLLLTTAIVHPAFGQETQRLPLAADQEIPAEADEKTVEAAESKPKVDPRILRREEAERREQISRLSSLQPQLPKESDSLTSAGIPKSLVPKRGIRSGRMVYLPSLTVGAAFTDNALNDNDNDNREKDVIVGADAKIRAQTLLRRHQFGVEGGATAGHSVTDTEDDILDWFLGTDGRFDLSRQHAIKGGLRGSSTREADSSAEIDDDDETDLLIYAGDLGYLLNGRRFDFSLDGFVEREDFSGDDTDDRDNNTYGGTVNLSQEWGNGFTTFLSPTYAITNFDDAVGNDGNDRDSYEITGLVGADYRPRPRLKLGGSLGYSQVFFNDPDVDDNGSVVGSLEARFAYSSQTDFKLTASREIDVTTVDASASETATSVSGTMTHLLTPKHAIETELSYLNTDFDDIGRVDNDLSGSIDYFHRFSDNVIFNIGYTHLRRLSNDDDEEFDENQARIGITLIY